VWLQYTHYIFVEISDRRRGVCPPTDRRRKKKSLRSTYDANYTLNNITFAYFILLYYLYIMYLCIFVRPNNNDDDDDDDDGDRGDCAHIMNNNNKCAVFDSTGLGQSEVLSVLRSLPIVLFNAPGTLRSYP